MNDFLIDMGITSIISLVKRIIPNDLNQKSKWKKALLKVFRAIRDAYKDDPDFV